MKRLFIILSVGLAALSCWSRSDRFKVDIDKALKKRTDARELYSEASAIPFRFPAPMTPGREISLLDVAVDRFFLLDGGKKEILVFDWDG